MKSILCFLISVLAGIAALAQTTNSTPLKTQPAVQSEAAPRSQVSMPTLLEAKPNEARLGKTSIDGIGVEAVKTDNPLELINPAAPAKYGSAEDNVVRDLDGKVSGLKMFSFKF